MGIWIQNITQALIGRVGPKPLQLPALLSINGKAFVLAGMQQHYYTCPFELVKAMDGDTGLLDEQASLSASG